MRCVCVLDGDDQEEELHSLEDTVESEAREEFDEEYEAEVERRYEQDLSDVNPTEEDIEAARADIERAEKLHRVHVSFTCFVVEMQTGEESGITS